MRKKIIILLSAIFILLTAGIAFSFWYISDSTNKLNYIIKLHQVEQLRRSLLIDLQSVQSSFYDSNSVLNQRYGQLSGNIENLDNKSQMCSSCHHQPHIGSRISRIQTMIREYEKLVTNYIKVNSNGKLKHQQKMEIEDIFGTIIRELQDMSHIATNSLENLTLKTTENISYIIKILALTFATTLAFSIFFAVRLLTSMTGPINILLHATRMISSGRLGYAIDQKFATEFGELADNFNSMSIELKRNHDRINQDIADFREAEERLKISEERYALAVQCTDSGLWDWDLKTDKIYFSTRWKSMLGYGDEDIGNLPEEWLKRIHPDDSIGVEKTVIECREGFFNQFQKDYRILHENGSYIWVNCRGIIVKNNSMEPVRIIGSQSDITDRKSVEDELLYDAFHDPLTNLPNRMIFFDHLQLAINRVKRSGDKRMYVVFYIDIDSFRDINMTYGEGMGNNLLVDFGKRIKSILRSCDTFARFEEDEFVILIEDIENRAEGINLIARVNEAIKPEFILLNEQDKEKKLNITISLGVAFSSNEIQVPEELIWNANTAMRHAKGAGKNCHKIYASDMNDKLIQFSQLKEELKKAIYDDEIDLDYQPIFSVKTGRICGFEALARWNHPVMGIIDPDTFIPIAEESGMMNDFGSLVLEKACRQIRAWQNEFSGVEPLTVSINISKKQCTRELVENIEKKIKDTGIDPSTLILEFPESLLSDNSEILAPLMRKLKKMNVSLQIDNFGTGGSSLKYLNNYPIDALKIDRKFISNIHHNKNEKSEIINAIALLAKNLNMQVIADGVETEEQMDIVKMFGFSYIQGNYISRPLKLNEVSNYLHENVKIEI